MNEFFPLTARGIRRNRRVHAVRIVIALALFGMLLLAYVTSPIHDIVVLVAPGLVALVIVCYFVWRARRLRSYGIQLTDAWIAESHAGRISGRTVALADISRIESTDAGALVVSGTGGATPLRVDQDIDNVEALRASLAERYPIVPRAERSLPQRRPLMFLLLWLVAASLCLAVPIPALVLMIEVGLCCLLAWWMFASRRLFGVEIGSGYRTAGLWLLVFFSLITLFRFKRH